MFSIISDYIPGGDQPNAIKTLIDRLTHGIRSQMLFGITGSGKTFTMANVIEQYSKPTLVMVHNKTLAAQIYNELKNIFPNNAVEYFVSYYDYYQPEAYIAKTDTYIEKDSSINEQIDLLRHSATRSLIERKDVIIVASISCIYGIGSPKTYHQMIIELEESKMYNTDELLDKLISLQYQRNNINFNRGTFRVKGNIIDIFPSHYNNKAWKLSFLGKKLEFIKEFDSLTGNIFKKLKKVTIFSNSHFVIPKNLIKQAVTNIEKELKKQFQLLKTNNKIIEARRLKQRTEYDLEMLLETGSCKGVENYSRFFTNRRKGEPPPTLFEYFPKDALLFVDESHVTIPQLQAMYKGDQARKKSLIEHGFRLPSALDNRPLKFDEWQKLRPQTIFVSATPGIFEINESKNMIVEQIIRPTGLLDPICIIKPAKKQIDDLVNEIQNTIKKGFRILITTLTKKIAEELTDYLQDLGYKVSYLHSNIHTLERVEILNNLRIGNIDIIVGINLLREGLNIPECSLVAILDADKEGFLRSEVALIQTIGRAARNTEGKVILYADKITLSIKNAVKETNRRRKMQSDYNKQHSITPKTITNNIPQNNNSLYIAKENKTILSLLKNPIKLKTYIQKYKKKMHIAASNLNFEEAAKIRDCILLLESSALELDIK